MIRCDPADGVPELVELAWGLEPFSRDQKPFRYIRSEGRTFESHRCLVPASEFHLRSAGSNYRVTLAGGDWFYLAGVWRPKSAAWPEAFAIATTEANADVAAYQERQGVVIPRGRHIAWLEHDGPEKDLLRPLPPASFNIKKIAKPTRRQETMPSEDGADQASWPSQVTTTGSRPHAALPMAVDTRTRFACPA